MAFWFSPVLSQKAPIVSLTKFPLLVPHTETSISARPQTTGQCTKNIYTASMTQFPSTAILHHTSNKANTQFGLLEGMCALHSLQKWLQTQQPRPNQQRQPSTSSVIAPLKTMWSTELSDEEDKPPNKDQPGITNDFLPLLLVADNDYDNNGYTP